MKKLFCLIMAVVLLVSLAACAGENEEEERICRVMTQVLTCPDDELRALVKGNAEIYTDGSAQPDRDLLAERYKAEEMYAEHLKTVFTAEDLTEDFQQKFCGSLYSTLTYPVTCVHAEISMSVESISVELISEENRRYGYSAELIITEKDGKETPYTQKGKVQLSEDGRISWIDVKALMELSDVVVRTANGML